MNFFHFLKSKYAMDADRPFDEGKVVRKPEGEGGGQFAEKPENALKRMGEKEGDLLDKNAGQTPSKNRSGSFLDSALESFEDNDERHDASSILEEFLSDKDKGRQRRYWRKIPTQEYKAALQKFMREGELFRYPESKLRDWLEIMIGNTMDLETMTALSGHTSFFPAEEVGIWLGKDVEDYEDGSELLDRVGFYDWAKLPDGTDAITDYGLSPLFRIFRSLPAEPSPAEMITAINRAMDVIHHRGDLASMFIDGGSKTLSQISNE